MPFSGPGLRDQTNIRNAARAGGVVLVVLGSILVIAGFASFMSDFNSASVGSNQTPTIWPLFLGIPMLGVGGFLLKIGFLGAGVRYVAGEVAPAARDTLRTLGLDKATTCPGCGATAPAGAAFCDACGVALTRSCLSCMKLNEAGARFCAGCGASLG